MKEMAALGAEIRSLIAQNRTDDAQAVLERAWKLIPEPKADYETTVSFLRSAVRLMAESSNPSLARRWANEFGTAPFSAIDAEPDYLLGIMNYALGNHEEAFMHFKKASDMSKGRCFEGEDPKYKKFFKSFRS